MGQSEKSSVGIIGGGKIGLELFKLFTQSQIAYVLYVVDKDSSAPAILEANKANIKTYDNIDQALNEHADLIIEVTGSQKIVERLQAKLENACGCLITHNMAAVILQVIQENDSRLRNSVILETEEINSSIDDNLNKTLDMISDIDNVTSEMRMLTLNARIEGARAGESGKGFTLVAEQMGKSTDAVRSIAKKMEQISQSVKLLSQQIKATIGKLGY